MLCDNKGFRNGDWNIYIFRDCLDIFVANMNIVHGFQQKNMVADRLADWGHEHRQSKEVFRMIDLPKQIWRLLKADKLGVAELWI